MLVDPQGCRVEAFKVPTEEELAHDFLWRVHRVTPARGTMTIFNRSHYEDVIVVRVHDLVPKSVWEARYDHIVDFERTLADHGTLILKFLTVCDKMAKHASTFKVLNYPHIKSRLRHHPLLPLLLPRTLQE